MPIYNVTPRNNYLTSLDFASPNFANMYSATGGEDIINDVISTHLANISPMRVKKFQLQQQKEEEGKRKAMAEDQATQAKIGATLQAVKEGSSLLRSPRAVETPEMGGGGAGTGSQTAAGEAGRIEAAQQTSEKLGETEAQYERVGGALENKISNLESEGDVKAAQELAGTLKGIGQTGLSLAGNLMNIERRGDWQDYAGAGINTMGLTGQGMKLVDMPGANLMSSGTGAAGSALGLAKGIETISQDPSNPAGYLNTGISGYQLGSQLSNLSTPAPAAAGGTSTTTAAGGTSVGTVLPIVTAAFTAKGAFGGEGRNWEDKSGSERQFYSPLTAGNVVGMQSVLDPTGVALPAATFNANQNSVLGKPAAALAKVEDIATAPIRWLMGDQEAFDISQFDEIFG